MRRHKVVVYDKMQRGYTYYCTEPIGRNFAPTFTPDLTPKQVLQLGAFGGKYMTDCRGEFPAGWFTHAKLCATRHEPQSAGGNSAKPSCTGPTTVGRYSGKFEV